MTNEEKLLKFLRETPNNEKISEEEIQAFLNGELESDEAQYVVEQAALDPEMAKRLEEALGPMLSFPRAVLAGQNPFSVVASDESLSDERKANRISLFADDIEAYSDVMKFVNDESAPEHLRALALKSHLEARTDGHSVRVPDSAAAQGSAALGAAAKGKESFIVQKIGTELEPRASELVRLVGVAFSEITLTAGQTTHTLHLKGATPDPGKSSLAWTWIHVGEDGSLKAKNRESADSSLTEFRIELNRISQGFYYVLLEWTEA